MEWATTLSKIVFSNNQLKLNNSLKEIMTMMDI